jgi:hypothetical protein
MEKKFNVETILTSAIYFLKDEQGVSTRNKNKTEAMTATNVEHQIHFFGEDFSRRCQK